VRTLLTEMVTSRSHCDLTIPWPGDKEIKDTVNKCGCHFIVASVIVTSSRLLYTNLKSGWKSLSAFQRALTRDRRNIRQSSPSKLEGD
jgi:hypothetical protein